VICYLMLLQQQGRLVLTLLQVVAPVLAQAALSALHSSKVVMWTAQHVMTQPYEVDLRMSRACGASWSSAPCRAGSCCGAASGEAAAACSLWRAGAGR
jgi:hypothetical protein